MLKIEQKAQVTPFDFPHLIHASGTTFRSAF